MSNGKKSTNYGYRFVDLTKQPDWAANGGQIEKYMHFNIDYSSLELKYFNM